MTTQRLPGSDAARHGTGDADLTIMLAAHAALRRDLERLARAAEFADLPDPGRRASVRAGWETFKRQLHLHHTAEDTVVWPALRPRLAHVTDALATALTGHLAHEERDGLPLIGVALTAAEWRAAGFRIARANGLSAGGEMFAWLADGAGPGQAAAVIGTLPPPVRLAYRAVWKPRYTRTSRW
jgi:hypothetical protein